MCSTLIQSPGLNLWFKFLIVTSRGRNVYVQFSSHQELTTIEQNSQGRGDEVSALYDIGSFTIYEKWFERSFSFMETFVLSFFVQ